MLIEEFWGLFCVVDVFVNFVVKIGWCVWYVLFWLELIVFVFEILFVVVLRCIFCVFILVFEILKILYKFMIKFFDYWGFF